MKEVTVEMVVSVVNEVMEDVEITMEKLEWILLILYRLLFH